MSRGRDVIIASDTQGPARSHGQGGDSASAMQTCTRRRPIK